MEPIHEGPAAGAQTLLRSFRGRNLPRIWNRGEKSAPLWPDFSSPTVAWPRRGIGRLEKCLIRTVRHPLPHLCLLSNTPKFPPRFEILGNFRPPRLRRRPRWLVGPTQTCRRPEGRPAKRRCAPGTSSDSRPPPDVPASPEWALLRTRLQKPDENGNFAAMISRSQD